MGGKSGTTTQSVSIPPEVLARYNAVNTRAEQVATTPFQPYTGQFVAPITATQQAGINNVSGAANMAQPYFQQAQQQQQQAYQQAMPYLQNAMQAANTGLTQASNQFGQSQGYLTNASAQGQFYGGQAYAPIAGALSSAQPYMQTAAQMTGQGLGAAAPLMGAAEGFLGGGTQAVNPQEFGQAQINKYMSPYMRNVVEAQQALQQQESAAQRSALNSQAIGAGAFGGDRAGIAQANLARQQLLANQATLGNLLQQGYGQAAGMFQQQQGIDLQAQQANRAAQQFGSQQAANLAQQRFAQQLGAGQQMAGLGQQQFGQQIGAGQALAGLGQQMYAQNLGAAQAAQGLGAAQYGMGAQQAGLEQGLGAAMFGMGTQQAQGLAGLGAQQQAAALQGAQAQIGAGTLEQQTQQAEATAQYQQFLQERGYPFQVAQFLANIAMGTGALSGSTTTTTQPMPFMSDRRMKKDVKEIGETHDGLPIYSFKYKGGDEQPRIGVMADEAREKHPDAVHRYGGIDAVDYEKIADRASEGGGVMPHRAGQGFAPGGVVSDQDIASIIAMQKDFLGPHGKGGLYGQSQHNLPGGAGIVPQKSVHVAKLQRPTSAPRQPDSGFSQAMTAVKQAESTGDTLFGDRGLLTSRGKPAQTYQALMGEDKKDAPKPPPSEGGIGAAAPAKIAETATAKAEDKNILDRISDWWVGREYGGGVRPALAQGGYLEEKVLPYQSEAGYGPEDVNEAESKTPIEPLKPGQTPGQSGGSGLGNLASAIGTAGTIAKAGTAVAEFLPALFALLPSDERLKTDMKRVGELDNGQPVYKYRFGNGPTQLGLSAQNVSEYGDPSAVYRDKDGFLMLDYDRATRQYGGGIRPAFQQGGTSTEERRYKIDPMAMEEMPEHRQSMIKAIYGPESNFRYDIRQGGKETFDTEGPHPGRRPARGGVSSAAGAGQFIYDTWNDVTGGAPMTKPYQDAATWTLAARDYERRTGRNLDEDLQAGGVTPAIKAALAPTWEAFAKQGYGSTGVGRGRSVAPAESTVDASGRRMTTVDGESIDEKPVLAGLLPTNYRTGQPFKGWGDYLTDRQFVRPLLSGLAGMAQSKSLYAVPAIFEGLGAAAAADAAGEKAQQEIAASKSVEQLNLATAANAAIRQVGNVVFLRRASDGREITLDQWIQNPVPLVGGEATAETARQIYSRKTGTPSAPGTSQTSAGAGTAPGTEIAPPPSAQVEIPAFITYDEAATKRARQDLQSSAGMNNPGFIAAANKQRDRILAGAQTAYDVAPVLNEMTKNIADSIALTGLAASGPGFNQIATAAGYLNSFANRFGFNVDFTNADDVKAKQEKYTAMLAGLAAQGVGQESLGALQRMYSAMPQTTMPRDTQAGIMAELFVFNKKDQHKASFLSKYEKDSGQAPYGAPEMFEKLNSKKYLDAVPIVKSLMMEDPTLFKGFMDGKVDPQRMEQFFREYAKRKGYNYNNGMSVFFVR